MNNIFASSIWLYLGDVLLVAYLIYGTIATIDRASQHRLHHLLPNLTTAQLRQIATFQVIWLFTGLVAFKWIILQGGPGFTHTVGTGNHGSFQFSTAGEIAAAITTLYCTSRWIRTAINHMKRATK